MPRNRKCAAVQSQTERHISPDQLDALLRSTAGIGCRLETELTDG
ncbi:hypothetical protein [Streptomyces sp. Ag109_G2-15]|nr:hypothetical protein [Streptomyces sp. Ag109_G2-15]